MISVTPNTSRPSWKESLKNFTWRFALRLAFAFVATFLLLWRSYNYSTRNNFASSSLSRASNSSSSFSSSVPIGLPHSQVASRMPQCHPLHSLSHDKIVSDAIKTFPGKQQTIVHYDFSVGLPSFRAVFDISIPGVESSKYGDIISNVLLRGRQWETTGTRFVAKKLEECAKLFGGNRSQCSFLDVGTNLGWYAFSMASLGFPVVAVEANARLYSSLTSTINLPSNGVIEQSKVKDIRLVPFAWGEKYEKCELQSSSDNFYGASSVYCGEGKNIARMVKQADVHVAPGDCFLEGERNVYVMKIDVEGHELYALKGMKRFFGRNAPRYIIGEVEEHHLKNKGFNGEMLLKAYTLLGYTCSTVDGGLRLLDKKSLKRMSKSTMRDMKCEYVKGDGWWTRKVEN